MIFRTANYADTQLLYRWRLQAEHDAQDFREGEPVHADKHVRWINQRIQNPLVQLLIWEENGQPVGMIRIDSNGELAYHADSGDVATRMLTAARDYADQYGGRLKASVDVADTRRLALLKAAGFVEYPVTFLAYKP